MAYPIRTTVHGTVDMDDALLVYSDSHGAVISLNVSACKIWHLCDGNMSVEEICRKLAEELGVDEAVLLPDIELGIQQLEEAKLITWKHPD